MQPLADLVPDARVLAERWIAATTEGTGAERRAATRLASLVSDPAGLELAMRFVDRVARPEDNRVAARELRDLARQADNATFVGWGDRSLMRVGGMVAGLAPDIVVPAARARLRQLVGHLVADADHLDTHIARARADGFRLNLNLLGEAVLGETEAAGRLERIAALVQRDDVDYVSVKVSAVASQLSTWDLAGSRDRVVERLLPLYRTAGRAGTFLNLDMEEYRDLALTTAVFEQLCEHPDLHHMELGIVLQAYLPDASAALDELTGFARKRVAAGGARIKIRLVKGANLAMEQVEAEQRGWAQAPYTTKADVDAHYVAMMDTAIDPARTAVARVGVASHNLYHVALAHLMAADRGVTQDVDIEMLQGMAPSQARAVRDVHGSVLLYTPVVARDDFDVAIAYLVRRLEENATPENFLHAVFSPEGPTAGNQLDRFLASVNHASDVDTAPRRGTAPEPQVEAGPFTNAVDTDPAVQTNRDWALQRLQESPGEEPGWARTTAEVDEVLHRAADLTQSWAATDPDARAAVLRRAATNLQRARSALITAMAHEAGKTVAEADPEVSEAVDFAAYYADRAAELDKADPLATFTPRGVTVVAPPWNFPVAIPIGLPLAALAAGSAVVLKPAPQTPRCARIAADAVRAALVEEGYDADLLQVVQVPENEVGRHFITHPSVARVLLTGSIETAQLFAGWRPDLDVFAETSGKNSIIVTPSADLDLAVADIVRSAFGHAGQKCSAASLLILVGAAGRSDRLRRQLADAVRSLNVGPATDISTTMGPVIEPPTGKLLRALTTLDPGERWLVQPQVLDPEGRLWRPGVKHGVVPGSFFHTTECFGPVLGVIRVDTLDEAIDVQNGTEFGLTGGLHSLDETEIDHWLSRVEVGNAYVNRHITGAIVQRQPFGGWKASTVGPGAKAGGPGYVAQLGDWSDAENVPTDPQAWLATAIADDDRAWHSVFGAADPTGLRSEENTLRYLPIEHLWVRVGAGAAQVHVDRVLAAARRAGVTATLSRHEDEPDDVFANRVACAEITGRIRVVGNSVGLREAAASRAGQVTVLDQPVLASASRELRTVLREQAISRTRHRFGHIDVT